MVKAFNSRSITNTWTDRLYKTKNAGGKNKIREPKTPMESYIKKTWKNLRHKVNFDLFIEIIFDKLLIFLK